MSVRVQSEDFDLGAEYENLTRNNIGSGAIVAFIGRVRDFQETPDDKGADVKAMTLEHYPAMTLKELQRIEAEALQRWPLDASLIIHRYGRLEPGDQIVLVLTAAARRQAAFEAASFLMDWLKTKAPFWKRLETDQGKTWVDAKTEDANAADKWRS